MKTTKRAGARLVFSAVAALGAAALAGAADWPQWRGPALDGTSPETRLPVRWTTTENVAWRLALPDRSGSTPIVSGDRVYLSLASGDALSLWAIDRRTGKVEWRRPLGAGNVTLRKHNMSSPSPVTDGRMVWVITGTGVLRAFEWNGGQKWSRDLQAEYGAFGLNWGYASSPLLLDGDLVVQVLHGMKTDDPSYVLRVDGATGKTKWKVQRPTKAVMEAPDSYTTPAVVRATARPEIVITGGDAVTGHDPKTGRELWRADALNPGREPWYRIVASPVVHGDLVVAPTRVKPMLALRAGGEGDVVPSRIVWSFDSGPDVPTPTTDGKYLYIVGDKGIAWCLDLFTGKPVYGPERLRTGTYSASPVLADGKIYVTSEEGVTSVLAAGPAFRVLAENAMEEYTLSTIAVARGQLFLRTAQHLYAIGAAN